MNVDANTQRLEMLARHKTMLLETRKRDGSWVATPVSLVMHNGRVLFRTYRQSGKAKRLHNFSEVRATPCTFLGKPQGDAVEGRARLLDERESELARTLLRRRHPFLHGVFVPLTHRVMRYTTQHYELTVAETD
jgi:PPOX class probable F420-dependent enzyme